MNKLDDLEYIKSLDRGNALESVSLLSNQIEQAWKDCIKISFPKDYYEVENIVISGMGGSSYGARIVKSLYDGAEMRKIPLEIANGYRLPGYVNEKSLVILSSYSGTTEETLTTASQARKKGAKISGITSGGPLSEFLKKFDYPGYIFNPIHNPSKQPRIGVGYMVTGLIGLLSKLNAIPVGPDEIKNLVKFLKERNKSLSVNSLLSANPGKNFAYKLKDKIPVFIVADFLEGAAYSIRNPFHETAKQFSVYFTIPELNHHLMEGLSFPKNFKKEAVFVLVNSDIYDDRNKKRLLLTKEVIEKNNYQTIAINLTGQTPLTQTFELIQIGAFVTFYLSILNGVDPSKIPWVDYFKKKLTR